MQHVINARARLVHGVEIEKIGLAEVHVAENFAQVFAFSGGEVIDASNLLAALQ